MSFVGQWDNEEKTIYRYTLRERWTLDEFLKESERGLNQLRGVNHPVHVLILIEGKLHLPPGLLRALMNMQQAIAENRALIVLVGLDHIIGTLINLLRSVAPPIFRAVHHVDSLEDAYDLIRAHQMGSTDAPNGD